MRRLKLVGPLFLAAALCFQTGCFRPYTLPESSGGETVQTLGTIGTSYTTDASDTLADTTGEDTTGSVVTVGSSSDASQGPSASSGTRPSTAVTTPAASGSGSTATTAAPTNPPSPPAPSEMKGVWVSYIELNTIFKNKTESAAKLAIDQIMDNCVSYGLNTVFFHVRANSDAYYKSSLFKPAASVANLIGNGFDPLAYAVASAHSRGLQLHAWVNPYRIGSNLSYRVSGVDYFQKGDKYYYVPTSAGAPPWMRSSPAVTRWRMPRISCSGFLPPMIIIKPIPRCTRIRTNGLPSRAMSIICARRSTSAFSTGVLRLIRWWINGLPCPVRPECSCTWGWRLQGRDCRRYMGRFGTK